jgi:glycerate kinase
MNIVIATDKFKGSLSSFAVCDAIEKGLLKASPYFRITKLPLADGGDGLTDVIGHYTAATSKAVTVSDPLLRPVQARFLISGDGQTAFIEMAQASGLMRLQPAEHNPMRTSTYGTGELIKAAVEQGATKIILGIGGSATNDGGIGMAAALGYRFLDNRGNMLEPVGENLILIQHIDSSAKVSIENVAVEVACDVENYLTGSEGATLVYGPQKGATPAMVAALENGMVHFAQVVKNTSGIDLQAIKGGGAAGGIGAGCVAFLNARLIRGVALLLLLSKAEQYIKEADLVLTGEGKLDAQTLQGKVVQGVVDLSARYGKPVIALCGTVDVGIEAIRQSGLAAAFSIINKPMELPTAMANAEPLLVQAAFNIGNLFKTSYLSNG